MALPAAVPLGGAIADLAAALARRAGSHHHRRERAVSAVIGAYLALFPRAKLGVVLPLGLFLEFVRAPASCSSASGRCCGRVRLHRAGARRGGVVGAPGQARFGIVFAMLVRAAIARRLRRQRGF